MQEANAKMDTPVKPRMKRKPNGKTGTPKPNNGKDVDARELLRQQNEERSKACEQEITEVFKRHGCRLDTAVVLTTAGAQFINRIVVAE